MLSKLMSRPSSRASSKYWSVALMLCSSMYSCPSGTSLQPGVRWAMFVLTPVTRQVLMLSRRPSTLLLRASPNLTSRLRPVRLQWGQ